MTTVYSKEERNAEEKFYRKTAKRIAQKYWNVEMTCPIEFVNREWKSTNAYFAINRETGECKIVMNHKVNKRRGTGPSVETLKHELVHWFLWSRGEPNGDDDPEFIRECLRIGASISGTKKAQKAYEKVWKEIEGE